MEANSYKNQKYIERSMVTQSEKNPRDMVDRIVSVKWGYPTDGGRTMEGFQ